MSQEYKSFVMTEGFAYALIMLADYVQYLTAEQFATDEYDYRTQIEPLLFAPCDEPPVFNMADHTAPVDDAEKK